MIFNSESIRQYSRTKRSFIKADSEQGHEEEDQTQH